MPGKPARAAELLAGGATGWWPAERRSPPEIWTDLATGEPAGAARRPGARARAAARVAARAAPAARDLLVPARRRAARCDLVSSAPVSGADRRRLDFWEVTASAGIPSLSIGWWAAAPWPGATVVENRAIFARAGNGVEADRAAIGLFSAEIAKGYGLATVYLPGCDISRDDPAARRAAVVAVVALLEDWTLRASQGECVLVVLAADSHPVSETALGRMVVFDGRPRARNGADPRGGRRAVDPGARRRPGGARSARQARGRALFARARSRPRPSRPTAPAWCL